MDSILEDDKEHFYHKSRRYLVIASGLLVLSTCIGIIPIGADHKFSGVYIFAFGLQDSKALSTIFLVIQAYTIWQFWTTWLAKTEPFRREWFNQYDCYVTGFISVFAISTWRFYDPDSQLIFFKDEIWPFIGWIIILYVVWCAFFNPFYSVQHYIKLSSIRLSRKKTRSLSDELTTYEWVLWFNPDNQNSQKLITFLQDGSIGIGANHNESKWRITEGLLEILDPQGKVYSRFFYNEDEDKFEHTNDPDTQSLRNQVIYKSIPEEAAVTQLWDLRSQGISLRNERVTNIKKFEEWKANFEAWRSKVLVTSTRASRHLPNWLERLDRTRPPPTNLKYFNDEHALLVRNMSEILARLQEYLEKKVE